MSVTRVPLHPIKKGALTKLWVGIVLVIAAAAALAWISVQALPAVETTESGLQVTTLEPGEGPSPTDTDIALVNYEGRLPDGTVFDKGEQQAMPVAGVVPGFSEGLKKMQAGGKYRLKIPSDLAYGATPPPGAPIPPNADLTFDVDLIAFKSEAELRAIQQQQMQMQMQQQGGLPQGAIPGMPPEAMPGPGQ